MKKSIIALTLVLAMGLGFTAVNAYARYCDGPGSGYGMRGWSGSTDAQVSDADYQKFRTETAQIRKSIAMDRAELNAIMAGSDPDSKKAAELTGRIVDNKEALAEIARSANINIGRGFGPGICGGPGADCPGPGYGGRGYGPKGDGSGPGYGRGYGRCR
ncbi:MAG: hypothetical protein SCH71_10605 [Desulfobulbaceae bacterium]|nr:hypothetical protein [Desulfobulbaceae bacterium]